MHTTNRITIAAPARRVYDLAAPIERWPEILPHYRYVRLLSDDGRRRVAEMSAWRDIIPVRWRAEQVLYPEEPRITFYHVGGLTKGMAVEWSFQERDGVTEVAISHDLDLRWPLVGRFIANWIVGPLFVANIAGKTLRRVRELAEGSPAAVR